MNFDANKLIDAIGFNIVFLVLYILLFRSDKSNLCDKKIVQS